MNMLIMVLKVEAVGRVGLPGLSISRKRTSASSQWPTWKEEGL